LHKKRLNPGVSNVSKDKRTSGSRSLAGNAYTCVRTQPGIPVLSIFTLGRFSLLVDGVAVQYQRKSPSKPLQLLKALIATGGRQVGTANLASILWPDQDGDRALRVFDTTLHRLRKFLGDDRFLLLQDGRLSLNSECVWVDAWEFERNVTALRAELRSHAPREPDSDCAARVITVAERIHRLYQGHFLSRDDAACWSVSLQERLRSKFVHSMIELGQFWETQGMPEHAIHCYQHGIEVDDLIETFYQRLMICLDRANRLPEAIAAYRQCRHVLSVVLGLAPTAQTQAAYQSIVARYRKTG
jgi:LuxR family maltose regulon positive regulatory protein